MKSILGAFAVLLSFAAVSQATLINFDNLPVNSIVANQYPEASFSTEPGYLLKAYFYNGADGTSSPNILGPANASNGVPAFPRSVYVDFPIPVNNLSFLAVAANEYGVIARVNVYSGATLLGTDNIIGLAAAPATTALGSVTVNLSAYASVTRIEMIPPPSQPDLDNSYGGGGLGYDNFSFSAVPEPGSCVLLAVGLVAVLALKRRR